jgi:hypothetical protein
MQTDVPAEAGGEALLADCCAPVRVILCDTSVASTARIPRPEEIY